MTERRFVAVGIVSGAFMAGLVVAAAAGSPVVVYPAYAAVGGLLVVRHPRNIIGWLLLAVAWGFAISLLPVQAAPSDFASGAGPVAILLIA